MVRLIKDSNLTSIETAINEIGLEHKIKKLDLKFSYNTNGSIQHYIAMVIYGPKEDEVSISKSEYEILMDAQAKLDALISAGVDNWSGYDYAMQMCGED